MIHILHGPNRFHVTERLDRLRSDIDPSGFATTVIENAGQRLPELRTATQTPGFLSATRLVIAHDVFTETKSRKRGTKPSSSEAEAIEILSQAPESTVLCVVEPDISAALLKRLQALSPKPSIERCDVPRGRDLVRWSAGRIEAAGARVDSDSVTFLLDTLFPGSWQAVARRDDVPPDLTRLSTELDKLVTAAGRGGFVDRPLITSLVPEAQALNLWGVTNAISANDPAAAARELGLALELGVAPEAITAQLAGHIEAYAAMATEEARFDVGLVASVTGISEGRLKMAARTARTFPPHRVANAMSLLRGLDRDSKLGLIEPSEALISVVVQIASDPN